MEADLRERKYQDPEFRRDPIVDADISDATDNLIGKILYDAELWREAQELGLAWAPIRRPEENLSDEHWRSRGNIL